MSKTPTRSPTHEDVDPTRLASIGLEIEEVADGETVTLPALIELAEDRGRPVSHYLAAIPLATELRVASAAPVTLKVCAGNCQRYGALDLLDQLAERAGVGLAPVTCLDRCDQAPACEVHGPNGTLVVAPATLATLDEAIAAVS